MDTRNDATTRTVVIDLERENESSLFYRCATTTTTRLHGTMTTLRPGGGAGQGGNIPVDEEKAEVYEVKVEDCGGSIGRVGISQRAGPPDGNAIIQSVFVRGTQSTASAVQHRRRRRRCRRRCATASSSPAAQVSHLAARSLSTPTAVIACTRSTRLSFVTDVEFALITIVTWPFYPSPLRNHRFSF